MPTSELIHPHVSTLEYLTPEQAISLLDQFLSHLWHQDPTPTDDLDPGQLAVLNLFHLHSRYYPEQRINTLLENHNFAIISRHQSQVTGFALLTYFNLDDLELPANTSNHDHLLLSILVDPNFQGQGIGAQLGTAAVNLAHKHHADLWSHVENSKQAEYLHQKMAKIGIRGLRYSLGCDGAVFYYPCPE